MTVQSILHTFITGEANNKAYDPAGRLLDRHPTVYKIVLIVSHFFRSAAMCGLMLWLPAPAMPFVMAAMTGASILYRAAIERFCCFRFALPSLYGAASLSVAYLGVIQFVSGAALTSVGLAFASMLAFIPLLGYTAWVIYLSHCDIEKRMQTLAQQATGLSCHC